MACANKHGGMADSGQLSVKRVIGPTSENVNLLRMQCFFSFFTHQLSILFSYANLGIRFMRNLSGVGWLRCSV